MVLLSENGQTRKSQQLDSSQTLCIWHILKNLQSASYAKTTVYTTVTKITNKYALKTIR